MFRAIILLAAVAFATVSARTPCTAVVAHHDRDVTYTHTQAEARCRRHHGVSAKLYAGDDAPDDVTLHRGIYYWIARECVVVNSGWFASHVACDTFRTHGFLCQFKSHVGKDGQCLTHVCGNGVVERGETCDGGRGCTHSCRARPGWACGDGGRCCPTRDHRVPCSGRGTCMPDGECVAMRDGFGGATATQCVNEGTVPNTCGVCAAPGDTTACRQRMCDAKNLVAYNGCGVCSSEACEREEIAVNGEATALTSKHSTYTKIDGRTGALELAGVSPVLASSDLCQVGGMVSERFELSNSRVVGDDCRIVLQVNSPVTIANTAFADHDGGTFLIDIVMNGGLLTVTNNTFHNISGGALRISGFTSLVFTDNVFTESGGVGNDLVHLIANSTGGSLPWTVSDNVQSGGSAGGNFSVFTLEGPFPYDDVLANNFDGSVDVGLRLVSFEAGASAFGSDGKAELRFVAVQNPLVMGGVAWLARGSSLTPSEDDICNSLCPESPTTQVTPTYTAIDVFALIDVDVGVVSGTDFQFNVTTRSNRATKPIVSFHDLQGNDLRARDSCGSQPNSTDLSLTWPEVCGAASPTQAPWTLANTSTVPPDTTYDHLLSGTFSIADLLACRDPDGVTPSVSSTVVGVTPVYSLALCVGLYECNNWGSEGEGSYAYHKSCTSFQITVVGSAVAVTEFETRALHFETVSERTLFNTATGQLHVLFTTRVDHTDGANTTRLGIPTLTTLGGSTPASLTWTATDLGGGVCTGANADAAVVCEQLWMFATTNAATVDEFQFTERLQFPVYVSNVLRLDAGPVTADLYVTTRRTRSSATTSRVTTSAQSYLDQAQTTVYNGAAGHALLVGESLFTRVTASSSDVTLNITHAVVCCTFMGNTILPYDPDNADTTGCNTPTAGLGQNNFTIFDASNNAPYEPTYGTYTYSLAGLGANSDSFAMSVTAFVTESEVECALQMSHRMFYTGTGVPIEIPVGAHAGKGVTFAHISRRTPSDFDSLRPARSHLPVPESGVGGETALFWVRCPDGSTPAPPTCIDNKSLRPIVIVPEPENTTAGTGFVQYGDDDSIPREDHYLVIGIFLAVIIILLVIAVCCLQKYRRETKLLKKRLDEEGVDGDAVLEEIKKSDRLEVKKKKGKGVLKKLAEKAAAKKNHGYDYIPLSHTDKTK